MLMKIVRRLILTVNSLQVPSTSKR